MDWASVILGAFIGVAGVFGVTALALYPLMRRSFLLWGVGRTIGFCAIAFAAIPVASSPQGLTGWVHNHLGDIGIALSAAFSALFLASYLERGLGLGQVRRRLRWAAGCGTAAAAATPLYGLLPLMGPAHDALLLATIVIVAGSLTSAIRRGSRAARYQAFAWGPLIAVGVAELSFELATGREYWLWPLAVLLAVMIDFTVTALGLVDGFMIIKRERDVAIADVREAMRVSTLDPLTGIANRRGVAQQFADATIGRPQGLAVIDCDHFKRVNDNFGHDVGDEVLVAVAEALQGEDVYIGRLGGEEFLALIYSEDWQELAERARERVGQVVHRRAPQLAFRITASAGVARVHDDDTLETAIKRADRALYAAKDAGRDRSIMIEDLAGVKARLAR